MTLPRLVLLSGVLSSAALANEDIPTLWKAKCANCHGDDGKAETKTGKKHHIEDMSHPQWQVQWSDEKIRAMILNGSKDNPKMKPFKGKLSGAEIDGLIKHIRTLKSES